MKIDLKHPVMLEPKVADFYLDPAGNPRERAEVERLWKAAHDARVQALVRERSDPIRYGWEPPIWKVCDALLGLPLFDTGFGERIAERFGWTWEEWSEAMRLRLYKAGKRLRVLLISGPNRSGKTEYAAKRTNQIMNKFAGEIAWCYAQNNDNSIEIMQPALFRHLPAELRSGGKDIKSKTTYIKYSQHNGVYGQSVCAAEREFGVAAELFAEGGDAGGSGAEAGVGGRVDSAKFPEDAGGAHWGPGRVDD